MSWGEGRRLCQCVLSAKAWTAAADLLVPAGRLLLLQVYSSGKGYDINIDNHRAGAFLRLLVLLTLMPWQVSPRQPPPVCHLSEPDGSAPPALLPTLQLCTTTCSPTSMPAWQCAYSPVVARRAAAPTAVSRAAQLGRQQFPWAQLRGTLCLDDVPSPWRTAALAH